MGRKLSGLLALALGGCVLGANDFTRRVGDLTGPDAHNCGLVALGDSPTAATECALARLQTRKPFWVGYQVQGIDSSLWHVLARQPDGAVVLMRYDSDTTGGGGFFPKSHAVVEPCPTPRITYSFEGWPVSCGTGL